MKLIPHRYPFLLVDRILSYDTESLIAIKSVTINEPFFQGHFPDRPIMPGVLIVEAMAQAASCLVVLENENKDSENLSVFLMKIDKSLNVRFIKWFIFFKRYLLHWICATISNSWLNCNIPFI